MYGCISSPHCVCSSFRRSRYSCSCRSPSHAARITLITLIAAATPIASSTAIFAQKFDQDYRRAVSYVCLSTFLSVATLPLVMLFAERLLS